MKRRIDGQALIPLVRGGLDDISTPNPGSSKVLGQLAFATPILSGGAEREEGTRRADPAVSGFETLTVSFQMPSGVEEMKPRKIRGFRLNPRRASEPKP